MEDLSTLDLDDLWEELEDRGFTVVSDTIWKQTKGAFDALYSAVEEQVARMRRDADWADNEAERESEPIDGSGSVESMTARAAAGLCALSAKLLRTEASHLQAILDAAREKREVPDYGEAPPDDGCRCGALEFDEPCRCLGKDAYKRDIVQVQKEAWEKIAREEREGKRRPLVARW